MRGREQATLNQVAQWAEEVDSTATRNLALEAALLAAAILVTVLIGRWTITSVIGPLKVIERVLTALGRGHLTERAQLTGNDEMTHMGGSLDAALDSLERAMHQIAVAARRLDGSAASLRDVSDGLRSQAGAAAQGADAADGIRALGEAVTEMSGVQTAIAAAVEEQTATTQGTTEHVDQVAGQARSIAGRIDGVADSTRRTDSSVSTTQAAAGELAGLAQELDGIVAGFTTRER